MEAVRHTLASSSTSESPSPSDDSPSIPSSSSMVSILRRPSMPLTCRRRPERCGRGSRVLLRRRGGGGGGGGAGWRKGRGGGGGVGGLAAASAGGGGEGEGVVGMVSSGYGVRRGVFGSGRVGGRQGGVGEGMLLLDSLRRRGKGSRRALGPARGKPQRGQVLRSRGRRGRSRSMPGIGCSWGGLPCWVVMRAKKMGRGGWRRVVGSRYDGGRLCASSSWPRLA